MNIIQLNKQAVKLQSQQITVPKLLATPSHDFNGSWAALGPWKTSSLKTVPFKLNQLINAIMN